MRRREAAQAILAFCAAPVVPQARAQTPKRIGVLQHRGGSFNRDAWGGIAFVKAMQELGYREGRDYVYDDRRWDKPEEIRGHALDLVRLGSAVIIAAAPPSIVAAKSATETIPIVMTFSAEPVATGLVRSLGRPGGNLTGLTWDHGFEAAAKAVELLKETLPQTARMAVLWDASDTAHPFYAQHFQKAAQQLGIKCTSAGVKTLGDLDASFAAFKREKVQALVVLPSAQLLLPRREEVMAFATRDALPTLAAYAIVQALFPGALLHYGPNLESTPRRAARYVDQILRGAKAGEMPIEQPDKYDLFVDLKAADRLGVKVPQSILARADRLDK